MKEVKNFFAELVTSCKTCASHTGKLKLLKETSEQPAFLGGQGLTGGYRESLTESKETCCPPALWVREQAEA